MQSVRNQLPGLPEIQVSSDAQQPVDVRLFDISGKTLAKKNL